MPARYDPDLLKYSTPGEDLKWSAAALGLLALFITVVIAAVASVLR